MVTSSVKHFLVCFQSCPLCPLLVLCPRLHPSVWESGTDGEDAGAASVVQCFTFTVTIKEGHPLPRDYSQALNGLFG